MDEKRGRLVAEPDDVEVVDEEEVLLLENNGTSIEEDTKVLSTVKIESAPVVTKQSSISDNKTEYRVQFLSSAKKLPDNSPSFKGLSPVDSYKDGNTYKYTYGSSYDLNEISKIQRKVRAQFKDAFVVKFKNGRRIK